MKLRSILLATVCGALVSSSALAQNCHCTEERTRDLAAARKMLDEMNHRKPIVSPIPLIHPTPRIAGGGGPKIHGVPAERSLNLNEK